MSVCLSSLERTLTFATTFDNNGQLQTFTPFAPSISSDMLLTGFANGALKDELGCNRCSGGDTWCACCRHISCLPSLANSDTKQRSTFGRFEAAAFEVALELALDVVGQRRTLRGHPVGERRVARRKVDKEACFPAGGVHSEQRHRPGWHPCRPEP